MTASRVWSARRSVSLASVAAVAALVVVATLLTPGSAQGQSVSTSTLQDGGVLRLRTGAEDHFRFEPTSGSAVPQTWSSPGCKVMPSSGSLVSLTSNTVPPSSNNRTFPGFFGDAFGVGSNSEGNGQPCGRIDQGQELTLRLNGSQLSGRIGDYAELDIEAKFGATIVVELWLDAGSTSTMTGSRSVPTGTTSDSGPDSGDLDNFRIRVPKNGTALFNRVVMRTDTPGASVSLEGGADGTPACNAGTDPGSDCETFSLGETIDDTSTVDTSTTDSLFHLVEVDGFLDCGDPPTDPVGDPGNPISILERLSNVGDPDNSDCVPIPYNLDSSTSAAICDDLSDPQCILLQKDLLGQAAQFYWTVTWVPEPGQYQETETQFDFGAGFQDLQLCLQDSPDDPDLLPELPPGVPWCVMSTSSVFDPVSGKTTVTEKYFGSLDPTGRR